MKTVTKWLVCNYSGEMRLLAAKPNLRVGECAFELKVIIPTRRVPSTPTVELTLPEWTEPEFQVMSGEVVL